MIAAVAARGRPSSFRLIDTVLRLAPFSLRVRSPLPGLQRHLDTFYADAPRLDPDTAFVDFDVELLPGRGWRRLARGERSQVRFLLDGVEPFFPLPGEQAGPMFEWGLNWCVAQRPLGLLVVHAAVVERDGRALVLPGFPGAGKSTLSAALTHLAGWRLLSDELALLDPASGLLLPHPRPISLKNRSIEVVAAFAGARLGPVYADTRKGTITHAAAPGDARARGAEPARPAWVVFPRFDAAAPRTLEPVSRVEAFSWISEQSFNQETMGAAGFEALCALLDASRCFEMTYGSTADALTGIDEACR